MTDTGAANLQPPANETDTASASATTTMSSTLAEKQQDGGSVAGPPDKKHPSRTPSRTPSPAASVTKVEKNDEKAASEEIEQDDESKYPGPVTLGLIMVALSLAVFLVALDQTIIAVAIPAITNEFNALSDIGWYGSAYMLTMCSFQLLYGKVYQYFSLKWTFLGAIGLFEIGSVVCGAAPTSTSLIVGRAIAGLGCSGIFSGSLIILANSVPLRKRPAYTGMVMGMYAVASVAGPLLGGVFTDKVSWRWCFYINLPIGAITIVIISFIFNPPPKGEALEKLTWGQRLREFDYPGTVILLPAIICLLLALKWGGTEYAWSSGRIIALLTVFSFLAVVFAGIQVWRGDLATVPPRVLTQRSIAAGSVVSFGLGAAFLLIVFYLPLWFQAIKNVSATRSGVMILPLILGLTFASMAVGGLVTAIGYYTPFLIFGLALATIGTGLLVTFSPEISDAKWIGYQLLGGIGIGCAMQQPIVAAQAVLKPDDIPVGTSILIFFQSLGGALFISVGQSVFTNKFAERLALIPGIDVAKILGTGATALQGTVPKETLPALLDAYNYSLTQCFIPSIAMFGVSFIASFFVEFRSVKGKKLAASAA